MDVEKTIEFILESQAKAEVRANRADKRLDCLERIVTQLAVSGQRFRSDVRAFQGEVRQFRVRVEEALSETTDKLNALIDTVDKVIRRNGKTAGRTFRPVRAR
jgi:hypothetical protein